MEPDHIGDIDNVYGISAGLFQISLASHGITESSATDPVFATTWSAEQICRRARRMWSTYHKYCDGLAVNLEPAPPPRSTR
jgi:hypothetical protein